jgi:hypothetical protein
MSLKQDFVHIIVYDLRSVKMAIADALNGKENTRVYYPNGNGVDMDRLIVRFINQLLFREGSYRGRSSPCAPFELSTVFSIMCIDKTMEIFDNNAKNGEDENILDNSK